MKKRFFNIPLRNNR